MLRHLPAVTDADVIVGTGTRDDAAVYRLDARTALVVTTDFFTPVVDDAYDFGRIAAANALSDVYAMGGRPLLALNLVAFPRSLPMGLLGRIIEGGAAVAREAGIALVGGHSIDDPEPKYGLAVVGTVSPSAVMRNVGAVPGDVLVLTKPLGTGVVNTALKRGLTSQAEIREVTELMATLNRAAGEVLVAHRRSVHALTDVTGFGLLGHLLALVEGSGVRARLSAAAVPLLDSARRFAAEGIFPGGSVANLEAVRAKVRFQGAAKGDPVVAGLLADAQTSGGLLAAVAPRAAGRILRALEDAGAPVAAVIGEVEACGPRARVRIVVGD